MVKERIKELINEYNAIILALEEDMKEASHFCNTYRGGRRSAFINVVDDLDSLLEDMEDQE